MLKIHRIIWKQRPTNSAMITIFLSMCHRVFSVEFIVGLFHLMHLHTIYAKNKMFINCTCFINWRWYMRCSDFAAITALSILFKYTRKNKNNSDWISYKRNENNPLIYQYNTVLLLLLDQKCIFQMKNVKIHLTYLDIPNSKQKTITFSDFNMFRNRQKRKLGAKK